MIRQHGRRALAGEQTGYAYTDDLAPEKILQAARIAAHIASGPARVSTVGLSTVEAKHNFYPVAHPPLDQDLAEKLELVGRADRAARAHERSTVAHRPYACSRDASCSIRSREIWTPSLKSCAPL